jgi:hypothetical protein
VDLSVFQLEVDKGEHFEDLMRMFALKVHHEDYDGRNPRFTAPSHRVHSLWSNMLLTTGNYAKFCEVITDNVTNMIGRDNLLFDENSEAAQRTRDALSIVCMHFIDTSLDASYDLPRSIPPDAEAVVIADNDDNGYEMMNSDNGGNDMTNNDDIGNDGGNEMTNNGNDDDVGNDGGNDMTNNDDIGNDGGNEMTNNGNEITNSNEMTNNGNDDGYETSSTEREEITPDSSPTDDVQSQSTNFLSMKLTLYKEEPPRLPSQKIEGSVIDDFCKICRQKGDLIECDYCYYSYHKDCDHVLKKISDDEMESFDFECILCRRFRLYGKENHGIHDPLKHGCEQCTKKGITCHYSFNPDVCDACISKKLQCRSRTILPEWKERRKIKYVTYSTMNKSSSSSDIVINTDLFRIHCGEYGIKNKKAKIDHVA